MGKMLFITPQFPYPLDNGGKKGALNGIKTVSKYYDVTVLSFCEDEKYVNDGLQHLSNECPNVSFEKPIFHHIHIRKKIFLLFFSILRGFITKCPYLIVKFKNKKMIKKIDELFLNNDYDVIFIDYINMGFYHKYILEKYNNKFKKIFFKDHNVEYQLIEQEKNKNKGIKKLILKNEVKKTFKNEVKLIKSSDICFSVCDENTEFLKKYNNNSFTMNPVYDSNFNLHDLKNSNKILYIGNLSWRQNIVGLTWFINEVFPLIRKKIEDAELIIAGSGGDKSLFEGISGIKYLGYVDDTKDLYIDSRVFIVPLFEGSGIRIKILDAIYNNIAIVSTSVGCGSIGLKNEENILIANDSILFSKYVCDLLAFGDLNDKIRNNGLSYLKNNYLLENIQEKFRKNIVK